MPPPEWFTKEAIGRLTAAMEESSKAMEALNSRLLCVTIAIAVMTLVLLVVSIAQLFQWEAR
ncbi:MAG: hypothetical protein HYV94_04560 [Candidatus Rokubacteria bacterium]|nr:hypothetical protein [Candidatus Rokubacteria bacterium]